MVALPIISNAHGVENPQQVKSSLQCRDLLFLGL